MSNDFSMHQLLPRSPQAQRNVIYRKVKSELRQAMIEIAIASGLDEDGCNNRKFMAPTDDTVARNLWEKVLTNLDQHAKQYYKREDKGRGIYMGMPKRVPGPIAAYDHIVRKLPSNRSSNSAYAQVLKHLISDVASRFNAVGKESPVEATSDRYKRFSRYFGIINKIEVSNVPDEAVDTHFSSIVETNSTNDEISTLVSFANQLTILGRSLLAESLKNPGLEHLTTPNYTFRRSDCENEKLGSPPEQLPRRWYKTTIKMVFSTAIDALDNPNNTFTKLLENESTRGKGKGTSAGMLPIELLGCTLQFFLKFQKIISYEDLTPTLKELFNKKYLRISVTYWKT